MSEASYLLDDFYFDDIDHFNHAIKEWDLQFRQLAKGKLNASDMQFITSQFQIGYCKVDKKVEQTGTSPLGVWSFVLVMGSPMVWKGIEVGTDEVIVLKPGDEIDGIGFSDFKVITLSLPDFELERICEEDELPETMKIIRENHIVRLDKSKLYQFKTFLFKVLDQLRLNGSTVSAPGFVDLCNKEIPRKLCQLIEGPGQRKRVFTTPLREIIIKKANQYITDELGDLVSISDLCLITNVSERTLQYTFKEYYGISPKAYLKARMLNKVHTDLRLADPSNTKVIDIASQWGFWHMGQFAADYKKMFGKSPSETLFKV